MGSIGYFSSNLAKEYGIIEATFLQMFHNIVCENQPECVVEDGLTWFPCAIKDWDNYIDLWTYRQTDRIVKNCLSKRLLLLRHYDGDERRRRGWYAINQSVLPEIMQAKIIYSSRL